MNPELTTEILGLGPDGAELIERFQVLLRATCSGYYLNLERYGEYAIETARKYVSLYAWYPMPQSMHKLLLHGEAVARRMELPIGIMS